MSADCLRRVIDRFEDGLRPGAAARLAHFWKETLGGEACELQPSGTPPLWCEGGVAGGAGSGEDTAGLQQCVCHFGAAPQQLVFAESRSAPPSDEYERNEAAAYHICVYLETAERFAACFRACEAAGLLYANPAYARSPPEFGNAMAWEEVQAYQHRAAFLRKSRQVHELELKKTHGLTKKQAKALTHKMTDEEIVTHVEGHHRALHASIRGGSSEPLSEGKV